VSLALRRFVVLPLWAVLGLAPGDSHRAELDRGNSADLFAQRAQLLRAMGTELRLSDEQLSTVRALFEGSAVLGQGNPAISVHPMTPGGCRAARAEASLAKADARCGAAYMVPIYDPGAGETADGARVCIDQYEFPDIPCEYPVVHATAREAVLLCEAIGKRICDAHEWEGACAGDVLDPDREYAWGKSREEMERLHNEDRSICVGLRSREGPHQVRDRKRKDSGLPGRRLRPLRLEHVSGRLVPRVHEPVRRVRPARQRRRAPEPPPAPGAACEPRRPRIDGNERQLVHLCELRGASRRLPLARAGLARLADHGRRKPQQLPPRIPLLQDTLTVNDERLALS
jgi:hypothetical protein